MGLVTAYLASRTYGLLRLPPFLDEALVLVWGRGFWSGGWSTPPAAAGKVLFVVSLGAADAVWPTQWPVLLAARLLSVVCGGIGLVCCLLVGGRLGGRVAAVVSGLVYTVSPFTLWHDRLALADSQLSAATGLVFWSSLALVTSGSWTSAVVLCVALTVGVLTKVTGGILVVIPLAALLMKAAQLSWRSLATRLAVVGGVFVPVAAWAVSRVASFPRSGQLAKVVLFGSMAHNLRLVGEWLSAYWTFPLWAMAVASGGAVLAVSGRRAAFLLAGIVTPVAFFVVTAGIWWPRYLLLTAFPVAIVIGIACADVRARTGRGFRWLCTPLLLLALAPAVRWDITAVLTPAQAGLPPVDRYQYVEGWASGYGSSGLVEALRRLASERGSIVVRSDRDGDRVPALVVKASVRNVEVVEAKPAEWLVVVEGRPTYALVSGADSASALAAVDRAGTLVGRWERPDGRVFAALYELHARHGGAEGEPR